MDNNDAEKTKRARSKILSPSCVECFFVLGDIFFFENGSRLWILKQIEKSSKVLPKCHIFHFQVDVDPKMQGIRIWNSKKSHSSVLLRLELLKIIHSEA